MLTSPPELTPLEQEVLEEYERLAENMKKVRFDLPLSFTHSPYPLTLSPSSPTSHFLAPLQAQAALSLTLPLTTYPLTVIYIYI
jgi:hypothetical protein